MAGEFEILEQGSASGVPLVLLHGLMGEKENWQGVMDALPSDRRAIALEVPFFEEGEDLNTIPKITDYVVQFILDRGYSKLLLGGNSLGGHVSLQVALAMPDRVAGLVLTGSSGLFERELGSHRGANPDREWYRRKMEEVFYDPAMVTDRILDGVVNVLESRRCRRVLVAVAKSAKRDNLASRLPKIQCPALLVWGRQDEITPPEVANEFCELLPNAELMWLDECGHAAMLEQPEAFGTRLAEWWGKTIDISVSVPRTAS